MRKPHRSVAAGLILVLGLISFVPVSAQSQVGAASATSPFLLRGANVRPSPGVPTWPVLPGDSIRAGETPVTLTLQDGTTIVLAPGASGRVAFEDGRPVFRLDSIAAHYTLKKLDGVQLQERDSIVTPRQLVGDLRIGDDRLPAGWWSENQTTLLLVGAGLATGLTVGVARRNGPPVSPTICNNGNGRGNGLPPCI